MERRVKRGDIAKLKDNSLIFEHQHLPNYEFEINPMDSD